MYNTLEYNPYKPKAIKMIYKIEPPYYTIYDITNKAKHKARGIWIDKGKVYHDYIDLIKVKTYYEAKHKARLIARDKKQIGVFIKGKGKAYIINKNGRVLNYFKIAVYKHLKGYKQVKDYIQKHKEGCTIHKDYNGYIGEAWR